MILPIKDGNLEETFNQFFREILEKKIVDALVVPQAIFSGNSYTYTLVKDPSKIQKAQPFVPVLLNNGATLISSLTIRDPGQKIGAVLRSCEIRGVIELAKFNQINIENLFIIGVDCLGTMELEEFEKVKNKNGEFKIEDFLSGILSGDTTHLREACKVCPYPVPENVPMNIGFIGVDLKREIFLKITEEIASKIENKIEGNPEKREEIASKITSEKMKRQEQLITELRKRFSSIQNVLNEFAKCKRCFNCMRECPICYCKECVFLTDIFEHRPEQYFRWAGRKGVIRLPYDTLLFHLTRLNHMGASCIGCGQCSSACPNNLPVFELFQLMGKDIQKIFNYEPGKDINEKPPIMTFKEEELEPL